MVELIVEVLHFLASLLQLALYRLVELINNGLNLIADLVLYCLTSFCEIGIEIIEATLTSDLWLRLILCICQPFT